MTLVKNKIGFQHVGSFLRPQAIKVAKKKFADGEISYVICTLSRTVK
ncbi:hypothetical protein J3U91_01352 [Oenococcus oeni]|uniref:Uncharacterized protein n=1 Tax=Oenococcus oeni AWRIB429 TaxID=655225 RepID=D3L8P4_OENOE|nr:hypothetical protein AWRIB429_0724 [Oenococcus oeni AWRIB429]KZD13380.1 Methionine synthase II [Oenococcus oeni]UCU87175.1 hypothetical protein J3U91_01352 [Oenococcus oeni]